MLKFSITTTIILFANFSHAQSDLYDIRPYKKNIKLEIDSNQKIKLNTKLKLTERDQQTSFARDASDDILLFGSTGLLQSEVHVSINKSNPNKLIASALTLNLLSGSSQGYYYSNDAGLTWNGSDNLENSQNPSNPTLRLPFSDPSTGIDANGKTYISSLLTTGNIGIQTSVNGSTNWSQITPSVSTNAGSFDCDKPMIALDNEISSPYANNYYCAWTDFYGGVNDRKVNFNRSINGGISFTNTITLKNGFGQGTNVQTGPNGEVYVCWADYDFGEVGSKGIGFTKSLNGGASFTGYSRVFNYAGIRDYSLTPTFNFTRMNDFPSMAVDKSNLSTRGRIYICYAAKEGSLPNGKSIVEVRFSDNQGSSWSPPTIVSIPNGNQNFMPWITVDDCDGSVYLIYFSFDSPIAYETNTYVAFSSNGGLTWGNQKISDVSQIFRPINSPSVNTGFIGEYIGITAYKGKVYPIWFDRRNESLLKLYCSPFYKNNMQITGADNICTSSSFNLEGYTGLATNVSWSVEPASVSITPNGSNVTVSRNTYLGLITLKALVTTSCGILEISKRINTSQSVNLGGYYNNGLVNQPIKYFNPNDPINSINNVCIGYNFPKLFVEGQPIGTNNLIWTIPNGYEHSGFSLTQQTGNRAYFNFNYSGAPTGYLKASLSNACSSQSVIFAFKQVNCNPTGGNPCAAAKGVNFYFLSPNPASKKIKIGVENKPAPINCDQLKSLITPNGITFNSIVIYNELGIIVKSYKTKQVKEMTIQIEDLITGNHIIEIVSGDYSEKQQLIIQH
jgi:hypothetical protein